MKDAVSSGIDSVSSDRPARHSSSFRDRNERGAQRSQRAPRQEAGPSKSLYIGNLYFEVTEQTLRKEFERFGPVASTKIIFDARGLSKGYAIFFYAVSALDLRPLP